MYRALGLDKIVWVFPEYGTRADRTTWGAPLRRVRAGEARYDEVAEPPLSGFESPASLDDYPHWPDPERFDVASAVERAREAHRDFAVLGPWVSLFEVYCQLRGLEQGLVDLMLNPRLVDAVLDRVEEIQTAMMRRFLEAGGRESLDLVFLSDDLGTQTGLLLSPESWRRHLEPRLRRWCELVHRHGLRTFFHTDGAAEALFGPLIDCGVDVLNPIQHACPGMEPAALKRKYGDRVIFHGGVDNQRVLPFGRPDEVRTEVRMLLDTLGAGREGYVCCSCHNVQAGTPVENVLAMVEAVRGSG
jgi:uroporphyrinogen decarboxylase